MRFNSYEFLLAFLPLVWAGWRLALNAGGQRLAGAWLALASLGFYAWWDWRFAPLLLLSLGVNLWLGKSLLARQGQSAGNGLLIAGLAWNIGLLGFFKYWNFLAWNLQELSGLDWSLRAVVLPLGISFFTFQKIAFLVDVRRGKVRRVDALEFSLFVLFFPQLIAGPIVHHADFIPQLSEPTDRERRRRQRVTGLLLLSAGLFQKCVIADTLAPLADSCFGLAAQGKHLRFLDAWTGVLAYTLQLYHDFSGYSHMAAGLSLLFGYRLPLNFLAPYRAGSMVDFWRRWHMSLSAFLRDYLYIPLGGNRQHHLANLFLTMLVAGLWHGAGWTFVAWGAWHGLALVINHLWRGRNKLAEAGTGRAGAGRIAAHTATFLTALLGWVLFRAVDLATAGDLALSLCGWHGFSIPITWHQALAPLAPAVRARGWLPGIDADPTAVLILVVTSLWTLSRLPGVHWLTGTRADDLVATPDWAAAELEHQEGARTTTKLVIAGLMLAASLATLGGASSFLYFQF